MLNMEDCFGILNTGFEMKLQEYEVNFHLHISSQIIYIHIK